MKKIYHYQVKQICLLLAAFFILASCKKDSGGMTPGNSNTPRKPVPAAMVGKWIFSEVSGSVIDYGGRIEPTWAKGTVFQINPDGTSFYVVSAETHSYASESVSRLDVDCTYEIDVDQTGAVNFKCYPYQGKNFENNIFLHKLTNDKLYPEFYLDWSCSLGEKWGKIFFAKGDERYLSNKKNQREVL